MSGWEHSLIEEIFAQKQREKSDDRDNLLHLTSRRLYGEKVHYALELIQNAEDEDSSSILFVFGDDQIYVMNDGRPFDKKDVWRICSVRPGEKKKKIGFFGIGFKSVFNITENPQIVSGKFNFEIEEYIYPKAKSSIPEGVKDSYSPKRGAIFVLPYCALSTPQELIDNFNLIDDRILLFLESLKKIKFIDNINNTKWSIEKNLQSDSVVSLLNTRTEQETRWSVFHQVLPVEDQEIIPEGKEGIEETKITIAFPLDSTTRDTVKKFGVVYCYLPTKKRTDLPFLIQADFMPTIGRENISDHQWNIWLLKELGVLAADAIDKIKYDEQFCDFVYDFIPISEEVQDDLIRHLFKSFLESIKGKQIAKTTKGWVKPKNCVIPADDRLRNVLTETDLKSLLGKRVFYVWTGATERARKVLLELGAQPIGPKEVMAFLKRENEIKKKNKKWFLNLYEYLSSVFDTTKKSPYYSDFLWDWDEDTKTLFEELQETKFLLNDNDKLVSLKDSAPSGRLICYPQRIDLSEVHRLFPEGEIIFLNRYFQESSIFRRKKESEETEEKRKRVKEWFDSIGVKKYFKQVHIIKEIILPKFATGKYKKYSDLKLYGLVDYIRRYWSTIESEIKNRKLSADFIEEIKGNVLLKTFSFKSGKKIDEYKNPDEIYFSRQYGRSGVMEELFEGIDGIRFVSSYYLNRGKRESRKKKKGRKRAEYTWRKFFELLGVWSSPRVVKEEEWVSISGEEGYNWVKKDYSPYGMHEIFGDFHSNDTERLIEYCSKIEEQTVIQKRMQLLWESLDRNWNVYVELGVHKSKYRYAYYQRLGDYYWNKVDCETSSFLEFLRNARWVLGNDEDFHKPSEVFTDTKKNRLLLGDDAKYVSPKANETFLKDLRVRIQPEMEEVIGHLKNFKERNPSPKDSKMEKMKAMYVFLKNGVDDIQEPENKNSKIKEMQEIFSKHELLYLPREDNVWWKPVHVFWKDCSNVFGTLRGYVEHDGTEIWNVVLKEFLLHLGVVDRPLAKECLDVLEELKAKGNKDVPRGVISRIYTHINDLVKQDIIKGTDWDREVFLSEKDHYLKPFQLYFSDNDEYKRYLGDMLEILWLPFSWSNVKEFLQTAGFRRLSQKVTIVKKFGDLNEIEGDATNRLIQRLSCVEDYLKMNNVELHRELQKEGMFKRMKELQAFETSEIVLDYLFKRDNPKPLVINDIQKDAYFSAEENRIYKSRQTSLLSTPVAKELSRLFAPCEDYVLPFLDSLFGAHSDEELNEKLKHFGIRVEDVFVEEAHEVVKIIPHKEEEEEVEIKREAKKHGKPVEVASKKTQKPQLPEPKPTPKRYDLINPDEFVFDTAEERTPYAKTEGASAVPVKTVKLRNGYPGGAKREYRPRERVSRRDAEGTALEVVMRFEEFERRGPDDRHKQREIGYDIYSKTEDEKERFIEVKHFRGGRGIFELTPYEWKKAEAEKDKYFVYVVSGLKEGDKPTLEIIQNPVKYLMPDPPIQKKFSDWKNWIIRVVRCKKV